MESRRIRAFQQRVLDFYRGRGRDLPWRRTTDAYQILVSEVMLQQTQAERVIPFFERWVARWPTVAALAAAERFDVLKNWSGLGYNNRAIRLHASAQIIAERYGGNVLRALQEAKLPGIGPYTVRAVEIFAANRDIIAVDTNIRRILIHEFRLPAATAAGELTRLAEDCLPSGRSREWHNALMDYGALRLTSRATGIRPVSRQSRFEGSDRQLRAAILRYFLSQGAAHRASLPALQAAMGNDSRCSRLLQRLVEEGVLKRDGTSYLLG